MASDYALNQSSVGNNIVKTEHSNKESHIQKAYHEFALVDGIIANATSRHILSFASNCEALKKRDAYLHGYLKLCNF